MSAAVGVCQGGAADHIYLKDGVAELAGCGLLVRPNAAL